ncbi:type IV pilus modification protein PilV [Rhodanobacter sp. C06]|uniref:type IV pilus modification protein PilV n=1 Tax=Rhodanobacter sp. C06 TaxID=1945854 RepID=UPI000984A24B|nr:type IV pilus modification protein PilV [Rhodanobacter sp. C06]
MTSHHCAGSPGRRHRYLYARQQGGVGLIEVLIAVLVLSVGFLGIAALQAHSLSINNGAMSRSMATVASYSILDAMRADIASAEGTAYNQTVKANACPAASTSLASVQLNLWCSQLASTLGAAASTTGTITCGNTGVCTIAITFDDSKSGTAGTGSSTGLQTITTRAML